MSDQDLAAQLREQARGEGWQAGYSASEETYTMLRIHARAAEAEVERLTAALAEAQQEVARQDRVISALQGAMNPQDCADALADLDGSRPDD